MALDFLKTLFWLLMSSAFLVTGFVLRKCQKIKPTNRIKLTSLSNELIFAIFARVPLREQLHTLPRICSKFYQFSKIVPLQTRSLSLIFGPRTFQGYSDITSTAFPKISNILSLEFERISMLNIQVSKKIVSTFPFVRKLYLSACGIAAAQLKHAVTLTILENWQTQLESLHLTFYFDLRVSRPWPKDVEKAQNKATESLHLLMQKMNQMTSLRRLVLSSTNPIGNRIEMPIIGQLSEFHFMIHEHTKESSLTECLIKYGGANGQLKSIGLGTHTAIDDRLVRQINTKDIQIFASKISHLTLRFVSQSESIDGLSTLLHNLPNLCSLTITWLAQRPLIQLFHLLVPATSQRSKLKFLKLIIVAENHGFTYDTSTLDLSAFVISKAQLHSIKTLDVNWSTRSHENFALLNFGALFPNLERLNLSTNCLSCSTCGYGFADYRYEWWYYRRQRTRCIKSMLEHCLVGVKPKTQTTVHYFSLPKFCWFEFKL